MGDDKDFKDPAGLDDRSRLASRDGRHLQLLCYSWPQGDLGYDGDAYNGVGDVGCDGDIDGSGEKYVLAFPVLMFE